MFVALVAAAIMLATACGSGGGNGQAKDVSVSNGVRLECKTEDTNGNKYDRCALAKAEQVYVEATVERKFEVDGFGLLKTGQRVKLVCYTSDLGNSAFGIVIPQGADRSDGDWTLGLIGGKHAYVGQVIEVAIADYSRKAEELEAKLEAKLGDGLRGDSCADPKVLIGHDEKVILEAAQ